ncbi:MAG: hypothetical protein Q9183_007132, partial [Haloplaca sp. 2 TL-2023]
PSEPPILETGIEGEVHATITPPEIFPREAGNESKVIDMDATPKPPVKNVQTPTAQEECNMETTEQQK